MRAPVGTTIRKQSAPSAVGDAYAIPLLRSDAWIEATTDGELAVDVLETPAAFIVRATLAGVRPSDLALSVHRDLLTIRGKRSVAATPPDARILTHECYWGAFSRSIILPESVDVARAEATLVTGVLTITLPKLAERTDIAITMHDDPAS